MEISGRLVQILPEQSGDGKNGRWAKCDFVIETQEKYAKKVCITAWNDLIHTVRGIQPDTDVTVSFDISAREYNGKWYNDVKAWKVVAGAGSSATAGGSQSYSNSNTQESYNQSPPTMTESSERSIAEDDLPF